MDETVYGIAERTDSGVVTLYHTRSKKSGAPSQPATGAPGAATCRTGPEAAEAGAYIASVCNLYEKYPIHVQIRRGAPQPAAGPAARQRACNPQVRFLLKTAVAAAAMIPLAFLFLHTTTASGTTLAQILKAMEKAPNVHVTRFFQDTDQVTYEMWVCRKPDIVLTAIERERTLYDLARWKKYADPTLAPAGGALDMSERERAGVRLLVETCLGFRAEDIPRGARWIRVDDNMSDASETYELTYSESGLGGGVLFRKCVIRIDSVTKLPIAVRGFRKASPKDNWEYARRTELQYLTAAQMAATLKQQGVRAESGIY